MIVCNCGYEFKKMFFVKGEIIPEFVACPICQKEHDIDFVIQNE